jgi:hypothetical protein
MGPAAWAAAAYSDAARQVAVISIERRLSFMVSLLFSGARCGLEARLAGDVGKLTKRHGDQHKA